MYIIDGTYRLQKYNSEGVFIGSWGATSTGDPNSVLGYAAAIAAGADRVYVADRYAHAVKMYTFDGAYIGLWGGSGSGPGQFNQPQGIAVAPNGNVYVSDMYNYRVQYFSATGAYIGQFGQKAAGPDQMLAPKRIDVARDGRVWLADSYVYRVYSATGTPLGMVRGTQTGDAQDWFMALGICAGRDGGVWLTAMVRPSLDIKMEKLVLKTLPATIDLKPDTLNRRSNGQPMTCYIEIPGADVNAIDVSSVRITVGGASIAAQTRPTAVGDYDSDGIPDCMVKFDRAACEAVLELGDSVVVTVSGTVDGQKFEGSDRIRVIGREPRTR